MMSSSQATYRIYDHIVNVESLQSIRHHFDRFRRSQHACLKISRYIGRFQALTLLTSFDNIDSNIFKDGINLLFDKFRWGLMDVQNSCRILRRESRCSCHCITAICCNDFLIGFQSTRNHVNINSDLQRYFASPTLHRSCRCQRSPKCVDMSLYVHDYKSMDPIDVKTRDIYAEEGRKMTKDASCPFRLVALEQLTSRGDHKAMLS